MVRPNRAERGAFFLFVLGRRETGYFVDYYGASRGEAAGNDPQPLPVPRHLGGVPQPHSKLPAAATRFFRAARQEVHGKKRSSPRRA